MTWISGGRTLRSQPGASRMQKLEDWFLRILPIEGEM
jgi:hypothetical protein